jgi:tRNA dimethylallyltransferase
MKRRKKPVVVCLVGPTAAGKTTVAVQLARHFPFEIISVDSAMVYRYMDIGTAKPGADVLRVAPHRLINIRDPWEQYSAGEFCTDARQLIGEISRSGRVPLLVGGTFLYFRALQRGMAPLPAAEPALRAALDERGAAEGWPALHAELERVDPVAAERIGPNDRQRIQRALEVFTLTGKPISRLQAATATEQDIDFLRIGLLPADRSSLYARIEARFAQMMARGFVDEVARLRAMPRMHVSSPAMRTVGYRQLWAHLDGHAGRAEATERAVIATRRLAKRQLTWMRSEPDQLRFDCLDINVARQITEAVKAQMPEIA